MFEKKVITPTTASEDLAFAVLVSAVELLKDSQILSKIILVNLLSVYR